MRATATEEELAQLRALLAELSGPALDAVAAEPAEELELLGLGLLPPFVSPEVPPEAVCLLPAALAERGDELAAGLLDCVAAFGPSEAVAEAAAGRAALAAAGVTSPFSAEVGGSRAGEALRLAVSGEGAELLAMLIVRPGGQRAHPATVMLDHEPCGGVVVDVLVGEAGERDEEDLLAVPAAKAASAVRRLVPEFERRCRDPRHWGPAKAAVTQMRSEGVDPTDQEAVDAWLHEFNARPREERDSVLGPALGPPPADGSARKRARRGGPKARKRNRRR
jgi:hypothetical protein